MVFFFKKQQWGASGVGIKVYNGNLGHAKAYPHLSMEHIRVDLGPHKFVVGDKISRKLMSSQKFALFLMQINNRL